MKNSFLNRTQSSVAKADRQPILYCFVFVFLIFGLMVSPAAKLLSLAFPLLAMLFAFGIYRLSKPMYAGYVCWLWMLAAFVRRVAEYRAGGTMSLIISAPFLACAIPFLVELRSPGRLMSLRRLPILLALSAILYGAGVGLIDRNPPAGLLVSFSFWVAPVLFGFFLLRDETELGPIRASLEKAFIWGALIIGAYGIYQYVFLAPWDAFWIENSGLVSIGDPEPQHFRVFSTMNSPQSFAGYMVIGILIAFRSKSAIRWVAIPLAALCLLLTQSRTAWFGFLAAVIYLVFYMPTRQRVQVVILGAVTVMLVAISFEGDRRDVLTARLQTLFSPQEDGSFNTRLEGYQVFLPQLITSPFGAGLGFEAGGSDTPESVGGAGLGSGDSAIIGIAFSFGIPGALVYLSAIFASVRKGFRAIAFQRNPDVVTYRAVIIAAVISAAGSNVFFGGGGFTTWTALAMAYALGSQASVPLTLDAVRSSKRTGYNHLGDQFKPPLAPLS